jgi:hypothetical protein
MVCFPGTQAMSVDVPDRGTFTEAEAARLLGAPQRLGALDDFLWGWWRIATRSAADPAGSACAKRPTSSRPARAWQARAWPRC